MASVRVVVVEDSPEQASEIEAALRDEGFEVLFFGDAETGLAAARDKPPDLMVLDVSLPGMNGIEACRELRTFSDAYVILLTGRDTEVDRLLGLAVGADDYMTKPFYPRELVARIRAMLRRPHRPPEPADLEVRWFGELRVDPVGREVAVGDELVELSRTEFDLLDALSSQPRVSLSRTQLLQQIWGPNWVGDDHVIDVHISNLRRKLGDDPRRPRYIRTVRGHGYRMGSG
jgi:DNA-binding response OmpR family regulator